MGLLGFLKDTFLPSAQTGAERRQAAFGTTSKVPAIIAGVVAGGAAAIAGAAGAGVLTAAAAKKAVSTVGSALLTGAKAIIPSTTKGKIIGAVATPIVVGAIASQPLGVAKTVAKAPGELAKFGADIADFAADPSIQTGKDLLSESPILAGATALGGALVLGKGALLTAAAIKTLGNDDSTNATAPNYSAPQIEKESTMQGGGTPILPLTPETQSINSTRRRYKKKKTESPRISQRVNVVVQAKSSGLSISKKYLNREVLIN